MVASPRIREKPLTAEQAIRRRNEDWRMDYENGRYDPAERRIVRRPVKMIAAIYGVDERTVLYGIESARRVKEAISHDDDL